MVKCFRRSVSLPPGTYHATSVDKAHLLEDVPGDAETVEAGRHAAIDRDLQEDFAQFGLGDAVVEAHRGYGS